MGFSLIIRLVSTLALVAATPNMFVTVSGDINYDATNPNVVVNLSGKDRAIISDQERSKFQLSDERLKNCVASYKGLRPTDAYLRSPTPSNDLYTSYGWTQVHRTVKPLTGTVVNISRKQELIEQKMFMNTQNTSIWVMTVLTRKFDNKLTSTWHEQEQLTVSGQVRVSASLLVLNIDASTSISDIKTWGQPFEHSQVSAISSSSEIQLTVPPNMTVYLITKTYKTVVTVRVEYEVTLDGDTAVNYTKPFQGHHFYGLDINRVMDSCGLSTKINVTEDINFDLITGLKIEVKTYPTSSLAESIEAYDDIE